MRNASGAFPGRAWFERMLEPLPPGATILDLGCGGGEPVARLLLGRGFQVTGIDLAQSAIGLAQTRFPQARWIRGDMRTVALDETFDGVIAWRSLTWLSHSDQALMATRATDWLAPAGRLLFNLEPTVDVAEQDYRVGTPYRADFEAANYGAEIAARGLVLVGHVRKDPTCGDAGVWLARKP